jgi:hypothetical protein
MEQIHKIRIWHDFLFFVFFLHGALCWTHVVAKHMLSIVTLYIYRERRYLSHRVMDLLVHHLDPSDWQINRVRRVPRSPSHVIPPPSCASRPRYLALCAPRCYDWATSRLPLMGPRLSHHPCATLSHFTNWLSSEKWLTGSQAVKNYWAVENGWHDLERWEMVEHFSKMTEFIVAVENDWHDHKNDWTHCNKI